MGIGPSENDLRDMSYVLRRGAVRKLPLEGEDPIGREMYTIISEGMHLMLSDAEAKAGLEGVLINFRRKAEELLVADLDR